MNIPFHDRVSFQFRYNGYLHDALGIKEDREDGLDSVRVFLDQLPKGWRLEHDSCEFEYIFDTKCIIHDDSGAHGWISTEIADIDFFAGKGQSEVDIPLDDD